VDGVVKLLSVVTVGIGRVGIRLQNGQLQTYGLLMLFGFVLFAVFLAGRRFF
jgi:NADH-quinone oxidoreductase subunit L